MAKLKRIGILGGSFNPIHLGHLVLAEQARELLRLQKVILMPANISPLKKRKALAPAQVRYRLVALALRNNLSLAAGDLEIKRGGVSYSVQSVEKLKRVFSGARLYFIVGADFLDEFTAWKQINKLKKICKIVIAQRPGYRLSKVPGNMQAIKISALDISSTDIRKRIKQGKSIRYLVPEPVRRYILQKRLYR